MTRYYEVDVSSIKSNRQRSEFDEQKLEEIAAGILTVGKLLKPLVLKQTGVDSYEIISGDLEYFSAVRAKEINVEVGETVSAFVIPPHEQDAALHQTQLVSPVPESIGSSREAVVVSSSESQRITNLESRLERYIQEIKSEHSSQINQLKGELESVKASLPQNVEPLHAFNTLNSLELIGKLKKLNIRGAENIAKLIEKERQKQPFQTITEIPDRVKGLGSKSVLKFVDECMGSL